MCSVPIIITDLFVIVFVVDVAPALSVVVSLGFGLHVVNVCCRNGGPICSHPFFSKKSMGFVFFLVWGDFLAIIVLATLI